MHWLSVVRMRGIRVCRRPVGVRRVGRNSVGPVGIRRGIWFVARIGLVCRTQVVGRAGGIVAASAGRTIGLNVRMGAGGIHRMIRVCAGGASGNYSLTAEDTGFRGGGDGGLTVILRSEQGAI